MNVGSTGPLTDLERFNRCMEYQPADRRPNHEISAWKQTMARWLAEAPDVIKDFKWSWMKGGPDVELGFDHREFVNVNFRFIPRYEEKVLEESERYEIIQNDRGIISRALKEGKIGTQRMSMNEFIGWPISKPEDWQEVKKRLVPAIPQRYPKDIDQKIEQWKKRDYVLCFAHNCVIGGFFWRAREFMGIMNLSYAWYDWPDLMHEIMEYFADYVIETSKPVLDRLQVDYMTFNEDMSMKTGPLLSPETYKTFIFPHMKRVCDFFRSRGVRYIAVDTDGDPTLLIPMLLDAGMDTIWPIERASNVDPRVWRKKFGRSLRMWGGVDKRVLTQGPKQIKEHLREFIPLIEEGGFIPTVDHAVPPDVSWDNFRYYMEYKNYLLSGQYGKLE